MMAEEDRYWCDFCGTYEDDIVCPNLGPVQTMQDSEVQSRARASLPKGLAIQNSTDGQEGVFARVPLSARMQFGPLEAARVQTAPQGKKSFPLKVFNQDGSSLYLDTTNEEVCNWMKFVRPANQNTEQNLVAYQQGTNIFFLTQKDIPVGGELRVWYAPNYAKKMGQHLLTPAAGGQHLLTPAARGEHLLTPAAGEQHLLTPGGHLSWGGSSVAVTHDKDSVPTPMQPRADKHSTPPTVHQAGQQEGITNGTETSLGQSESLADDLQQSKTVTRWNVQENIIKRAKVDTIDSPRIEKGKDQGQKKIRKTYKRKGLTVPDSGRVSKAKDNSKTKREKTQTQILFLCAGCADVFENEDVLREHIEKEHPDKEEHGRKRPRRSTVKLHFCQVCQDGFAKNSELLFHSSTCHVGDLKRTEPNPTEPRPGQEEVDDESDEWNGNDEVMSDDEPAVPTKRRKRNGAAKKTRAKKEYGLEHAEQMWCVHCDVTFSSPGALNQHGRVAHGLLTGVEKKFQARGTSVCQHCSAPFCSPIKLKAHTVSLHGPNKKSYKCGTCQGEFLLPRNLQDHLKQTGSTCKLRCEDCGESFASLAAARVHQQLFHPLTRHQTAKSTNSSILKGKVVPKQKDLDAAVRWCKYCDLAFQSMEALKVHMTKYHGTGLGGETSSGVVEHCSLCNAPFTFRRTLRTHLQEVHKVLPDFALEKNPTISPVHECHRCCEKFPGPAQLQVHLEERMGECTMSCQQCGKSFNSLPCLRLHEYHKHSMVECRLCHKSFVNVQSLGRHMKKVHEKCEETKPDSPPDWCQYCDISFAEKKSFTKHMKVYHGVGHPESAKNDLQLCSQCDAPFTSMKSMLKHVQDIHGVCSDSGTSIPPNVPKTHNCPTCLMVLQGPQQLQAHLAERNGQCRMTCEVCGQTFHSLPLFRSHEDNMHRSVKCKLCKATFRNATVLGKHMKNTHNPDSKTTLGSNQRWCPYCDQTFVYTNNFTTHMRIFHYPSGYSSSSCKVPPGVTDDVPHCEVCDAPFASLKLLTRHIHKAHELPAFTKGDTTEVRTHTPHQCETCCQTFRGPQHLDNHLRSSQGKCQATCPWCHKAFYRLSSLRVHQEECSKGCREEPEGKQSSALCEDSALTDTESVVLDTLEQQWCSHCDLVLSSESALSKHMTECHEEGSEPEAALVYCRACNSPFTDEAKLLSHSQKLHDISPSIADSPNHVPLPVHCGSCQKCHSSVQELEEHLMARNHACQLDCKTCGMRFHSILRLRWHRYRTHANSEKGPQPGKGEFVCDVCSSFFSTAESLANHLSGHAGQDVYQCTVCSKLQPGDAILKHVLAHEDQVRQDFSCPGCSSTFDQKDALLQHLQTHKLSRHTCPLCKSTVNNVEELTSHLEGECSAPEQKYRCPLCAVVCLSVSHLCTHIKQCKMPTTAKSFFSCQLCKVRFTSKSALRRHQALQHSGPGQWLGCPHCEYRTQDSESQLWKHFAEHDLLTKLCEAPKDDVQSTAAGVICTLCGTTMPEKGLSYHLKKHKKVEYIFKCRFCPGEFFTDQQLRQHTDKHLYQDGVITCPICDCPISSSRALCKHLKKVHQLYLYQCPVCQKEMIHQKSYENHLAIHKGDIVLEARVEIQTRECDICGRRFPGQSQMKRHRDQVHLNVRKFKCDVCKKDFKRKGELVNHMSVHTDDYPHLCMYCGKSFKVKASLNQHITIHLNIKKHVCSLCGKAFNQKVNLKKHLESHSDSKKFQCDACGKTFKHSDSLTQHMRLRHLDQGKSCRFCGKKFIRESVLKLHENAVHNGIKTKMCQVCGQAMTYEHTLRRHFRRMHPDLFDQYFPARVTGKGNSCEKKVGGNLGSSGGRGKSARQRRKRGQKEPFPILSEGPTLSQHRTVSTRGMSAAQKWVVTDSGDMNKDTHTTVIIINDQDSTERNVVGAAQLAEAQASTSVETTLAQWVPSQFQGNAESSCEIIMSAGETVRYMPE